MVAFFALHDNPGLQVIAAGDGTGLPTILVTGSAAAVTGEFEQLDRLPDINVDGDIAFMGDTTETTGVFFRSAAGVLTTLAQESDGYLPFTVGETFVSLNNADAVSFNATGVVHALDGEELVSPRGGRDRRRRDRRSCTKPSRLDA